MIDSIYYTFLTRCHAKYYINEYANTSISAGKLVDEQGLCILTNQPCNGIAIRPSNEEIINCLGFFLEEIKILQPKYIILYGERVKEFVLRTFGLLELPPGQQVVKHNGFIFIVIEEDELPNIAEIDVQSPSY